MNLSIQVALVVAYLLPVVLLAWWISRLPSRRPVIAVLVLALLPLFYLLHYQLLHALQGWPSMATLPDEFRLLSHVVHEPNPSTGESGYILLWARPKHSPRPRVFELAYDKTLHTELDEAAQRQAAGKPQRGKRIERAASEPLRTGVDVAGPDIRFFDDPNLRPPAKPLR